jgi:hypothetical protein
MVTRYTTRRCSPIPNVTNDPRVYGTFSRRQGTFMRWSRPQPVLAATRGARARAAPGVGGVHPRAIARMDAQVAEW